MSTRFPSSQGCDLTPILYENPIWDAILRSSAQGVSPRYPIGKTGKLQHAFLYRPEENPLLKHPDKSQGV